MIEKLTEFLEKDLLYFSKAFQAFQLTFDNTYSHLSESKLTAKLSSEAQDLLSRLKLCEKRILNDITQINCWLADRRQLNKKTWFISNLNLRDCFNTCENTVACYDKFLRKDIKLLKETFEGLIHSIEVLNNKLKDYNDYAEYSFIVIDESFTTLHKTVIPGFDITKSELLSLNDFQKKYPAADNDFVEYVNRKSDADKKEEWKWLYSLEEYFEELNS